MFDQNITNSSSPDLPLRRMHYRWYVFFIAITLLMAAFGAVLNLLLFTAIVSSRKLRSGSGTLIAHSIFLETIICASVLPFFTVLHWTSLYNLPTKYMCRAAFGSFFTFVWSYNWSSLFLAANRFVAVCYPQWYAACVTKRALGTAILFSWTMALGCMAGLTSETIASAEANMRWGGCGYAVRSPGVYVILTALGTSVPAVLEGIMYISLFMLQFLRGLFRARGKIGNAPPSSVNTTHEEGLKSIRARRLRMTQTVFATYVWSELCYLFGPISFSTARPNMVLMEMAFLLAPALILLGYATSPIIYLVMNSEYRKRTTIIVRGLCNRQRISVGDSSVANNTQMRRPPTAAASGVPSVLDN